MENLDTVCKPKTKWLTKDRFWNFVFWFGMSGGWIVTALLDDRTFSFISSWLTILGVPLLVRHFSKTTFVKDTIFKNSEGIEFDTAKRTPNVLLLVLSTIGLSALTGSILDGYKELPELLGFAIIAIVLFGVPSLFFIFKNCPISILFNRKTWQFRAMTDEELLAMHRRDDSMTSPGCSYLPGNIYHNSHRHH